MRYFYILLCAALLPLGSKAQKDSARWDVKIPHSYKFVHYTDNQIANAHHLHPFFEELYKLKRDHKGVVKAVHIGDSHIQADMMTSHLRRGCQQHFGNAGRGIVFPYQLAKSNGPTDVTSSSDVTWQYSRLSYTDNTIQTGICGFGIHSSSPQANVKLRLKPVDSVPQYFNKLTFFTGTDKTCYKMAAGNGGEPVAVAYDSNADSALVYNLPEPASEFEFAGCKGEQSRGNLSLYGVSMEMTDSSGVLYHTIGVNGAQFEQFNRVDLFWQQLRVLKGGLFIVSMGTNEAQNQSMSTDSFYARCDSFLSRVRSINPNAMLLITTPAGSYYKGKTPNAILPQVTSTLVQFCKDRNLAYWDLYTITGGKTGTIQWKKNNLLARDLVHYSAAGYTLQGQLLLEAIAHAYNQYVVHRPKDKKPDPKPKRKKTAKQTTEPASKPDTTPKRPDSRAYDAPDNTGKKHVIKVKIEDI